MKQVRSRVSRCRVLRQIEISNNICVSLRAILTQVLFPSDCSLTNPNITSSMALIILIGAFLSIWLSIQIIWNRKSRASSVDEKLSDPPLIPTPIPVLGHILGIISKGSNAYISSLW
jgi:hypothetical protein